MARRRTRNSQHQLSSEHLFQEYISNTAPPQTTRIELLRLIRGGEDTYLELKVKLSNSERIAQEISALANTAGGTIVFGVSDKLLVLGVRNPNAVQTEIVRICREEIYPQITPYIDIVAFDSGQRIVAADIKGKTTPYRTRAGKFYLRTGAEKHEATRKELSGLLNETRPLFYENIPVEGAKEEDFDDALLWSFTNGFEKDFVKRKDYDTANVLKKDLLLALDSKDFLPTVGAMLLFGRQEKVSKFLPYSKIGLKRFAGNTIYFEVVEETEIYGNLLFQYEFVLKFIKQYCDLWKHKSQKPPKKSNSMVEARGNYHLYSINEAVANLLVHRDLALGNIETRVNIYEDSIEFINPRRTNGFVPLVSKAIRYGITQKINPQISAIFSRREYGAKIPQGGLPMILRQSREFSGKRVELYTTNDEFRLKIFGA